MQLDPAEVERFYAIWMPLMHFVNRRLRLVPAMLAPSFDGPWDVREVKKLRDALWKDDSMREAFLTENPEELSAEDLAIVESWRYRRPGDFYVLRQLKKYAVVIAAKESTVYGVQGLLSPLAEVVPFVPCYVKTVLLPFEDRIIFDSLMVPYNVVFGRGITGSLERTYKDAKEREAIVTSLLPSTTPTTPEAHKEQAATVNARTLEAFRKHLFRSGLSPKVVQRDVDNVTAFADGFLLERSEPCSLREFSSVEVRHYVTGLQTNPTVKEARRKEALLSLKRLVRFLRDTDRMDYDTGKTVLEEIKGS